MKSFWAAGVILAIWLSVTAVVIGRTTVSPTEMYFFASAATLVISLMGFL